MTKLENPECEIKQRTFYEKVEEKDREEDVPRGYVKVIQLITYAIEGKRKNEFDELVDNKVGKGVFFCQKEEDKDKFIGKNKDLFIESFTIQLRESTAIDYLDSPENMDAFGVK